MCAPRRLPPVSGKVKRDMEDGLLQAEIHRDRVINVDRLAAIRRRPKMPLTDRFACRFAETVWEILDDLHVIDGSIAADNTAHDDRPLDAGAARHRRIARHD